jgi:hypothetical protein
MDPASPHAQDKPPEGARVGRYRLVGKLHDGPLGELWAARIDEGVDASTPVLLRRVPRRPAISDEIAHGLVDAARAAMRVEHELVVPVLDVVSTEAEIGIVSYAAEGELLRALLWRAGIKRSPIPPSIALRVALDLLEAVAALSEHPDRAGLRSSGVCADNVLVTTNGRARLLEPIVSSFASEHDPWSHEPKWASYRAPEALRDAASVDERADVFTVGVLLWEMLRNRPLFGGARFEAVERSVAQGSIGRADSLRPPGSEPVNRTLADAVARALERAPGDRFASLNELAAALRGATGAIARADGVGAFVQRVAAESLARQHPWLDPAVRPSAVPAAEPKAAPKADPDAVKAEAPVGVPDFRDLFGASTEAQQDGAAADAAEPGVAAAAPPESSLEADRPAGGSEPPVAQEAAAAPESAAPAAPARATGQGAPRGAFVLGAVLVVVLVLLWLFGPLGNGRTEPGAEPAATGASATVPVLLDAGTAPAVTGSGIASAPASSAPPPETSAGAAGGAPSARASDSDGGAIDTGAAGTSKPKSKKKKGSGASTSSKPKYMPGTL